MVTRRLEFVPFVLTLELGISAIKDVVYENANLMSAGHWSMHGQASWRTHADDAFLLGCRKLGDFLMNDKRSRLRKKDEERELDDVLALDYIPANSTRAWNLRTWTAEWRNPMNKQLVHIAYSRGKVWVHWEWAPKLEEEFREAWRKFRVATIDEEFRREFDRQVALCQAKPGFENIVLER